jgi:NADH dehydrogenase
MEQLYRAIFDLTGQTPDLAPLPDFVGDLMSRVGFLPGAPITRDQWLMLQHDNVAAADCRGLRAFGIEPVPLAAVGSEWLDRFGKFPKRPQRTLGTGIAR